MTRQPAYNQIRPFSGGLPCIRGRTNRTESTRDDSSRLAASRLVMSGQPNATRRHSPSHLNATPQFVLTLSRSIRRDFSPQIKSLRQFPLDRNRATDHNGTARIQATVYTGPAPTAPVRQYTTLLSTATAQLHTSRLLATKQVGPTLANPREATYRYVLRPFGSSRRPNSTRVDSWRQFGPARLGSVQGDEPCPVSLGRSDLPTPHRPARVGTGRPNKE